MGTGVEVKIGAGVNVGAGVAVSVGGKVALRVGADSVGGADCLRLQEVVRMRNPIKKSFFIKSFPYYFSFAKI
jgi:hypothetical protein